MTTPHEDRIKLEEALRNAKVNEELFPEICKIVSGQYYIFYKKLMDSGFTEHQALEIIKARGTTFTNP